LELLFRTFAKKMEMLDKLKKFEAKKPEIIFEWNDSETDARGWVVINSLRGGAAGGGTRMRVGLDQREVESLAKTMEVKFSVCGPAIGGAKSGINFNPADPRKEGVLRRWYQAVMPLLKNYYGTGGDLNIDEIHEVIPITREYGLLHPQEGVVNGHFKTTEADKLVRIKALQKGVSKVVEDPRFVPALGKGYTVADMITGWGVSESIRLFYQNNGQSLQGKTFIMQGWGNVAAAAAFFLGQAGASMKAVIDRNGGLIHDGSGYSFEEITQMFLNRNGNALNETNMLSAEEIQSKVWDVSADIFVPAAASRLVQQDQIDRLIAAGLQTVSCGANVPFADTEIFFGPIAQSADARISVIPDFVANCGMARTFAYLMGGQAVLTDQAIFEDVTVTMDKALKDIAAINSGTTGISASGFEIALDKLL
jgi:glutamate dehydrogenase/leucine dehydrogenase